MKHLFPLLLTAILFCSCGQKVLLDEESTFVNNKWMRFDEPVQFSFNNDNTEDFYNFIFSVSIDTNRYHQNGLPITVELCSPNGEVRTMFSDIVLRNGSVAEMREAAQRNGMITLREAGLDKIFEGTTTIEEVVRETVLDA